MSEPRKAALLLPNSHPETQAEREAFAAQHLACQLYAGNHDMVIVGLFVMIAGDGVEEPARASTSAEEPQLPVVGIGGFDLALAVAHVPEDDTAEQFAQALEELRAQQIEVVLVERHE